MTMLQCIELLFYSTRCCADRQQGRPQVLRRHCPGRSTPSRRYEVVAGLAATYAARTATGQTSRARNAGRRVTELDRRPSPVSRRNSSAVNWNPISLCRRSRRR